MRMTRRFTGTTRPTFGVATTTATMTAARVAAIAGTAIAATSLVAIALTGCSSPAAQPTAVTVVTHDSFAVPDDVLAAFEASSGLTVTFVEPGDAGTLVNQLILTKDAPLGDVVYGIDNSFASRAIDEGIFTDYGSSAPAAVAAAAYAIPGSSALTAIDYSDVCVNVDHRYFVSRGLVEPVTLEDLTKPAYKGLLSVTNPATSSPGLAFLLATVAAYGDAWPDYWARLRANDLRVTASWTDSYYSDFSGPSSGGAYPLVLSYASSPPFEVGADGVAPTGALLDTCFRQVEYAGVLKGAKNPDAAKKVIDWMLSDAFQAALPEYMYVYPVSTSVTVPPAWTANAPLSPHPYTLDPATIATNRNEYIRTWTSIVLD
jgi:thiamine transport system substrate-binding protein